MSELPYHLRDDVPPLAICDTCHRLSWTEAAGQSCEMRQPDGAPCGGVFQPTPEARAQAAEARVEEWKLLSAQLANALTTLDGHVSQFFVPAVLRMRADAALKAYDKALGTEPLHGAESSKPSPSP